MDLDQLLALSVRIARAHTALTELRTELDRLGSSYNQLRMVDNALQALDTLSTVLRASPGQADEH